MSGRFGVHVLAKDDHYHDNYLRSEFCSSYKPVIQVAPKDIMEDLLEVFVEVLVKVPTSSNLENLTAQ